MAIRRPTNIKDNPNLRFTDPMLYMWLTGTTPRFKSADPATQPEPAPKPETDDWWVKRRKRRKRRVQQVAA